ncbi:thiolase-like protein [Hyaloraphidium curvatum]|nr:thiolase-like protein [Hyaloraphidium curvatum]
MTANGDARRVLPAWPEPVAIIGAACRLPGGADTVDAFWDTVIAGAPIFSAAPNKRWATSVPAAPPDAPSNNPAGLPRGAFLSDAQLAADPGFFGLSDKELAYMDPHQYLALAVCSEALRNAGIREGGANAYWDEEKRCATERAGDAGVFVGMGVGAADMATIALQAEPTPFTNFGYLPFAVANRVSHTFGFTGPSVNIDTACSGSLTAVHYACMSLLNSESEIAIAAGINVITNPSSYAHISALRILSPSYHSPILTPRVDGYTRGEAAVALVLKRLSAAERDGDTPIAVVRGTGAGHNGRTGRHMATPSMEGQARCIRDALARAGLPPGEVDYLELHATGTQAGDKRELQTAVHVYGEGRDRRLRIGGVKSMYGHSEGASGITSLLKGVMVGRHGVAPPVLHFDGARGDVELPPTFEIVPHSSPVPLARRDGTLRVAVNSFGAGGTNACAVIESRGEGAAGYPRYEYEAREHSMPQQRVGYYRTAQVRGWEGAGKGEEAADGTGGASGIGAETALRFALAGCSSVFLADLPSQSPLASSVLARIRGAAPACRASFLPLDVTREGEWMDALERVHEEAGPLDVLVNCAGYVRGWPKVQEHPLEVWKEVMEINATGTFLGCKHGVASMERNKVEESKSIINLSSIKGLVAGPDSPAYEASKGAVRMLTKSVALSCAQQGLNIRCNSVHPGWIRTPFVDTFLNELEAAEAAKAVRHAESLHPRGELLRGSASRPRRCGG